MSKPSVRMALVGDYDPALVAHQAIPIALDLAAQALDMEVRFFWIPTESIESASLSGYQAVWSVPGSPYRSMKGALNAIRMAREGSIPFIGTCGGFQHALIEYARNILLLPESDHLESNPQASLPLIAPLSCSLSGTKGTIMLRAGSRIEKIYNLSLVTEIFNCNFGVNPSYQHLFETASTLHITGIDASGNARVMELDNHPFFIATLYQPERSALAGICHPLVKAFVQAALLHRKN